MMLLKLLSFKEETLDRSHLSEVVQHFVTVCHMFYCYTILGRQTFNLVSTLFGSVGELGPLRCDNDNEEQS